MTEQEEKEWLMTTHDRKRILRLVEKMELAKLAAERYTDEP